MKLKAATKRSRRRKAQDPQRDNLRTPRVRLPFKRIDLQSNQLFHTLRQSQCSWLSLSKQMNPLNSLINQISTRLRKAYSNSHKPISILILYHLSRLLHPQECWIVLTYAVTMVTILMTQSSTLVPPTSIKQGLTGTSLAQRNYSALKKPKSSSQSSRSTLVKI